MKKRKPTHPGLVFRTKILEAHNLTVKEVAPYLKVSRQTLSTVINGGELTLSMASKFAVATDTSPEFWYNLQVKYNLWKLSEENVEATKLPIFK